MSYKPKLLAVVEGGTGLASTTASQLRYSSATSTIAGLATANNGTLVTSSSGVPSVLAGPGTTGNLLQSNAAAAPSYSTSTYPATNAANTLLYASSANVMAALTTANSGILATNGSGVPSITTASGNWLNTTRTCFNTYLAANIVNTTGNGAVYNVLFDTTLFDQGTNITLNSAGKTIFTAPVTGKYKLIFSGVLEGVSAAMTVANAIITTTTETYSAYLGNIGVTRDANTNVGFCIESVFSMTAGNTAFVSIAAYNGVGDTITLGGFAGATNTGFKGYLVC